MSYLLITPFFPTKSSFVGSYLLDQAKEINKQTNSDFKVIVIESILSDKQDYKIEGISCFVFRKIDFPSFFLPGFFQKWNNYRFLNFLKSKNIKVDDNTVCHGHITYPAMPFLTLVKNKFKSKTILQHHGLDILQFDTGRINFLKNFRNKSIKKSFIKNLNSIDLQIGVSKKVVENLLKIDSSIQTYVLYNGVDSSKFFPVENKLKTFKIGCVANFWELKDQKTLIKALELLLKNNITDWQCEFVGTGTTKQDCVSYVKSNNIANITFTDKIDHNDLNDFYNQIDLFVLPSFHEALGCVYLESWATNTPFLALNNQGIGELLNESQKQKLLVDKGDYNSLAEKIIYFKEKKEPLQFDSKYTIENTISNFLTFIRK
jgi:glycosyltransferase involved in cell wall biosynthesis